MRVTDVQLTVAPPAVGSKVLAYVTVVLDDELAVHDVKLLDGPRGYIVAMPSRKVKDQCPACSFKNPLAQRFCGGCGGRLQDGRDFGQKVHADVCHPIRRSLRLLIEAAVLERWVGRQGVKR